MVLPYTNDTVEEFARRLVDLTSKFYPDVDLKVLFTCPNTISNLFSFKDKTPTLLKSKIVYRTKCIDCSDFYIGKTSRCLTRRIQEHKSGIGELKNIKLPYLNTL